MGERSSIEWTGSTWTPIRARDRKTGKVGWHCEHASEGCRFCYSESINLRLGTGLDFKPANRDQIEIFLDEEMLLAPLRWKKPRKIFVCSMTDAFADFVQDDWLDQIFAVMALAPQHTYQALTKRSARMRDYICQDRMGYIEGRAKRILRNRSADPSKPVLVGQTLAGTWPWPHVWLGVSVERQREADERIPDLMATPATVRFLSCEPLLGAIDLAPWTTDQANYLRYCDTIGGPAPTGVRILDWVIVGGESGRNARPMELAWAYSLIKQCESAGVACFVKQLGAKAQSSGGCAGADPDGIYRYRFRDRKGGDWEEWLPELRVRQFPAERGAW